MATQCDEIKKYGCGNSKEFSLNTNNTNSIEHTKDINIELQTDSQSVPLYKRERNFTLSAEFIHTLLEGYYLNSDKCFKPLGAENEPCLCVNIKSSTEGQIIENYTTMDSEIYYLDIANSICFYKEVTSDISLRNTSSTVVLFKQLFGNSSHIKYKLDNVSVTTTIHYKLIVNNTNTTLYSTDSVTKIYDEDNPLILVYPNPPSLALPLDPEIKEKGFYDYFAGGPGGDKTLQELDGGSDYYYPEWNRNMGANNAVERKLTDTRYLSAITQETAAQFITVNNDWQIGRFPIFNAAKDSQGNIFVSGIIEDKVTFNKIYTMDGLELSPEQFYDKIPLGNNNLFMPISII